jgi:carbon monoxide dehydrogenase subunit G
MRLEHRFRVPAGLDDTWALLLDVKAVQSILPGLSLDEVSDGEVAGSVRVDVGDHCVTYRGEAAFQRLDPDDRSLVVEAAGRDAEDGSTASAVLAIALEPDGDATTVVLEADLDLAGGGPADSAEASAVVRRVMDQLAGGVAERFGRRGGVGVSRAGPVLADDPVLADVPVLADTPPHPDVPVLADTPPHPDVPVLAEVPVLADPPPHPDVVPHTDDPVHQERPRTGTVLVRRRGAMPVPAHRAPSLARRAGSALARPATDETAVWVQRGALAAVALALLAVLIWLVRLLRR